MVRLTGWSRLESSRQLKQPTFSQDRLGQPSRKNDRLSAVGRLSAEPRQHYVCVNFVVDFAFFHRRAPPCLAWPLVFGRCLLADMDDPIVSGSPPVLAAGRTFAIGSAVCLVARAVHPHVAVFSGTRVTENLHTPVSFLSACESICTRKSL